MSDIYYTIKETGESLFREKMSRFLGFAVHATTADEAKAIIKEYQNKYHDSRHVCWAYMLGPERKEWQLNDNGEPSGTAGKPILGQINSAEITDVVVIVVRYFGGIKLGTSGLIAAYREAAKEAIEAAGRKELYQTRDMHISFPYVGANDVMKLVKGGGHEIVDQKFDNVCEMLLRVRLDKTEEVEGRLRDISGVSFLD